MKIKLSISLILLYLHFINTEPHSIVKLDDANYKDTLLNHNCVILFYDSTCTKSKKYENVIHEAIQRLVGESLIQELSDSKDLLNNVVFAKVDGLKYSDISNEFDIYKFPTVLIVKNKGKIIKDITTADFRSLNADNFLSIIKKKFIRSFRQIIDIESFKEINRLNYVNLLFCNNTNKTNFESSDFKEVFMKHDDVFLSQLNVKSNETLIKLVNCPVDNDDLILFTHFDEKEVLFSKLENLNITPETIDSFLTTYAYPVIKDLNNDNIHSILQSESNNTNNLLPIHSVIYLYKGELYSNFYSAFYYLAKQFRHKLSFYKVKEEVDNPSLVSQMMNVEKYPSIVAFKYDNENLQKFKMDDKISNESFYEFLMGFISGSLQEFKEAKNNIDPKVENKQSESYIEDKLDFSHTAINKEEIERELNLINIKIIEIKPETTNQQEDTQPLDVPSEVNSSHNSVSFDIIDLDNPKSDL